MIKKYSDIKKSLIKKESHWDLDGAAYVTHLLQNQGSLDGNLYLSEAEDYLRNVLLDTDFNSCISKYGSICLINFIRFLKKV